MFQSIGFLCVLCLASIHAKIVDLSHYYNANKTIAAPAFFDMEFKVDQRGWLQLGEKESWLEYNSFRMPEHLGTHIDAPSHFNTKPGGLRLHEIPIEKFVGDAVVIDISHKVDINVNPDVALTLEDVFDWEKKHGEIKDGSIVFMNSGWDQYWGDELKFLGNDEKDYYGLHFPGFSSEAAQWLVDNRKINGIGSDCISFDMGNNPDGDVHRIILGNSFYGLENVKNLGKIPEAGARVHIMPINIYGASGGPTRIFAEFNPDGREICSSGSNHINIQGWFVLIVGYVVLMC